MSSFDERSEALDKIGRAGQVVGYSMAQRDLLEILGNMDSVSFDSMRAIMYGMESKYKERFPDFGAHHTNKGEIK